MALLDRLGMFVLCMFAGPALTPKRVKMQYRVRLSCRVHPHRIYIHGALLLCVAILEQEPYSDLVV